VIFLVLTKLRNVLENLLQKVEEFLAVDIVLKSELDVVVKYLLEDLIGGFLINALPK